MTPIIAAEPVPLQADTEGVFRVGGTRVTLDSMIGAYREGATAEAIADRFPAVSLSDVYAVIGWYLRHQEQADAYLHDRQTEAALLRVEVERQSPTGGLRERLLARRQKNG